MGAKDKQQICGECLADCNQNPLNTFRYFPKRVVADKKCAVSLQLALLRRGPFLKHGRK